MRSNWFIALPVLLAPVSALADQISADRPGAGSDASVVPQFTAQTEIGTDSKEFRFGVLKGFEVDTDGYNLTEKAALTTGTLKSSIRVTARKSGVEAELPADYTFSPKFNLSTDVIVGNHKPYATVAANYLVTDWLTVSPEVYYEGSKACAGVYASFVVPGQDNLALDVSYANGRASAGLSVAFNLSGLFYH